MAELETLEIVIEHKASSAATAVGELSTALRGLKGALNTSSIEKLANGFTGLDSAIKKLSDSSVMNLERVSDAVQKLGGIDVGKLFKGLSGKGASKAVKALEQAAMFKDPMAMSDAEFDKLYNNYTPYIDYTKSEIAEAEELERHMESISSAVQIKPYQAVSTDGYAFAKVTSDLETLGNEAESTRDKLLGVLNAIQSGSGEGASAINGWFDGISPAALKSRIKKVVRELTSAQKELLSVRSGGLLGAGDVSLDSATANVDMLTAQLHALQAALKKIDPTAKEASMSLEETGKAAGKSHGRIGALATQFMRLAKMRMMRAVLRSIAQGLRTGVDNLYQWSKATNGAFASSMDAASSSMLTMKNSIATAVAPALMSLVPILQTVVNWVVTAMNAIAQLLALLRGASSWTRAKTAVTEYGAAAKKSLGGAGSAAKNVLADFDELNVLNRGGGGGGGGSAGGMGYEDMFEEVGEFSPLLEKLRPVLQFIGDHFTAILGTVGALVAVWKGFKWAASLREVASVLGGGGAGSIGGGSISGMLRKMFGLTMAIVGAYNMGTAFIDQWKNGINDVNSREYLLGTVESVGGLALAFGEVGAGVGLVVAGTGQAVAGMKDMVENGSSFEGLGTTIAGIGESIAGIGLATGNIPVLVAGGIATGVGYIIRYANDIRQYISDAAEYIGQTFTEAWEITKEVFAPAAQWFDDNVIAPFKYAFEPFIEWYTDEVATPIKEAFQPVADFVQEEIVDPVAKALEPAWETTGIPGMLEEIGRDFGVLFGKDTRTKEQRALDSARVASNSARKKAGLDTPSFLGRNLSSETLKPKQIESAGKRIGELLGNGLKPPLSESVQEGMTPDEHTSFLSNAFKNKVFTQFKTIGAKAKQAISEQIGSVSLNATVKINADTKPLEDKLKSMDISGKLDSNDKFSWKSTVQVNAKAGGGTVERGDLFIANEAGAELVGRIGNRTGVANQQQIADVISQQMDRNGGNNGGGADVAAAVAGALKNVVMYVDGVAFGHLAVKKINEYQSATGRVELRI